MRLISITPTNPTLRVLCIGISTKTLREFVKRLSDIALSGLVLLVMAPVIILVALAIRLDSPGPVLFQQLRMGKGARPFRILKFRTMVWGAEQLLDDLEACNWAQPSVFFRIKNDPRVTRVGWFLRRTSLDELPQLVNILQGKMSLVGPRPLQIRDCKKLATIDPVAHDHRLAVLPGLTGLAQVSGRRDLSFDSMIELDSRYAQSWSLALDIEILCRTVIVVITGRGAY
jgi:lipopolysaccharide/colanic/teichoic acid biosynthesis glycosyltransferase